MALILKLSADLSWTALLHRTCRILANGDTMAYPTETFYGLGVDATNEAAIRKIYDIKGRDFNNPVSVIIGTPDQLHPLTGRITDAARKLMETFWPGPMTIIFEAADGVSKLLTAGTGKIGVRLSGHEFARNISLQTGKPITATSANLSGAPECADAEAVIGQIGNKVDAIIDLGEKGGTIGSSIIDATSDEPVLLRPGVVSREDIAQKTGLIIRQRRETREARQG